MSTASKRRRTSPSTYVTVNGQGESNAPKSPGRASYLSPTKASLARTNPDLLPKIAEARVRRESSPTRRRSLRDAVLNSRKEDSGQSDVNDKGGVQTTAPEERYTEINDTPPLSENSMPQPTIPVTREPSTNGSDLTVSRSPLRTRQSSVYTPRQYRSIPISKTPRIVPTLVQSTSRSENSSQANQDAEEGLPPTPVQLGNDQRPYRPRGLASSSPGGEGRKRIRAREGTITSSPLKPRISPPRPPDTHDHVEIASGLGREDEDSESGPDGNDDNGLQQEPADILDLALEEDFSDHGHAQLKALQEELKELESDCTCLETLDSTLAKFNTKNSDWSALDASLEILLSTGSPTVDPLHPPLESHELFQKNPIKFLTLFSPGNLVMSYETWEKKVKGVSKFVYETTFAPPNPWPKSGLNVTFETTFDLETDTIEHIRFNKIGDTPLSHELEKWIHLQLHNPIAGCDLAAIVTGIGRYFEADVARARVFKQLAEQYFSADQVLGDDLTLTPIASTQLSQSASNRNETLSLLPFLTKTQMSFVDSADLPKHKTRRSSSSISAKEIMLVYEIKLNWIGKPTSQVSIVASGFTSEASEHAKKMFDEIDPISGIVHAFESVCDVLGIGRKGSPDEGVEITETNDTSKAKGKVKKNNARRMTDFN